ncbi:unnamed protein product [Rotaria magnacalcarata]|uniref:ZZ-type domain-containing protein n=2 Tax=Rotaria magnacalcarata TaxID=392030 RepID=A0A815YZK9_9BILA|nr:unnamed protein product [Rotaria magnacalcarata]CAF1644429.1 unnamed protein product [Rotaria magnacalcarata]CAF2059857.1 unnamed protein product [Rotaria magnacalcarata]CAF3826523.1 unnamed protein product [Rotaria magnacalcarata]CAF3986646.1 unnamed protein product [Rotaria magnacalcarata]
MTSTEIAETTTTVETNDEKYENLYVKIVGRLEPLSAIKFAAYRVACKLRVLQKYLKLTYVDYNILVRAFNTHQLHFGAEASVITNENARKVLTAIYQLISSYHFNESSMDEIIDTLLRFLCEILHIQLNADFDLNSFKIILFALSNAKLPEKYRCFFRQITSPNVIASQGKLNELFEILLKLPNHFDNVDSFHADNIPGCVQSCLDHTHDGIIREDIFVNWMSREPQTLVWLPTLHRLIATETVRHEAQCDTCKIYPVIGMRYRCLRCFNYDLCQTCFFTGDHAKKHDGTHPIEEYCKQVTPFEDLKAFLEFIKLKIGKRELRRKERYLTIERSKSFSDTQVNSLLNSSSQLMTNGHHSLNRQEQSNKKTQIKDIYRAIPKGESNGTSALINNHDHDDEETTPLTGYDNYPIEPEKKKVSSQLKKKLTDGEPLLEKDRSLSPIKPKKSTNQDTNYVNLKQKKISSLKHTQIPDDDAPILMPKQHTPVKKLTLIKQQKIETIESELYQLPPNDRDDNYQPPLPPKQRQQNNTSHALVYDFIGSELQELRVALAQFDGNSSIA